MNERKIGANVRCSGSGRRLRAARSVSLSICRLTASWGKILKKYILNLVNSHIYKDPRKLIKICHSNILSLSTSVTFKG